MKVKKFLIPPVDSFVPAYLWSNRIDLSIGIIHAYQRSMACKILIVEDNFEVRELMVLVLRRAGYDVAEAATGLAAIDQTRATRPDLIIMDLGLPGITGDEATARLKADPSTKDIPVIVNTAFHKTSSLVERAMAVGAAEILHKPTSLKTLQEVVRRYSDYTLNPTNSNAEPLRFADRIAVSPA